MACFSQRELASSACEQILAPVAPKHWAALVGAFRVGVMAGWNVPITVRGWVEMTSGEGPICHSLKTKIHPRCLLWLGQIFRQDVANFSGHSQGCHHHYHQHREKHN